MLIVVSVLLVLNLVAAKVHRQENLPPTCDSPIYCYGDLLHTVQTARVFSDSKTFVDMRMRNSVNETLESFEKLMEETNNSPTRSEIGKFVNNYFESGNELDEVNLIDWKENPKILSRITKAEYASWARALNGIWKQLARKVKSDVLENSAQYSILTLPHTFVIPGGRFREPYYWDSYWIVSGLLICEMPETARSMLDNFIWLVETYGYVPNGGRVYYTKRSQPPLLTAMVSRYIKETNDLKWLRANIRTLEKELEFWLNERTVLVKGHQLARYYAPSKGPRPESYSEDFNITNSQEGYIELKSAAESGWDFSTRWFVADDGNITRSLEDIHISNIIPVDLNAYLCGAFRHLADLYSMLGEEESADKWINQFNDWKEAVYKILYNKKRGVWFDYNFKTNTQRQKYYASNIFPLWTRCLDDRQDLQLAGNKAAHYLLSVGATDYPGGVPTSGVLSGEQWDFPNAWPPLVHIVAEALANSGDKFAESLAEQISKTWIQANYVGFENKKEMYEKYSVLEAGSHGGGGEYEVQLGFGWTNGVIFAMLDKYAANITVEN